MEEEEERPVIGLMGVRDVGCEEEVEEAGVAFEVEEVASLGEAMPLVKRKPAAFPYPMRDERFEAE